MDYIDDVAGGLYTYDGSIFAYDWNPIGKPVDDLLGDCTQKDALYKAIHIEMSTKVPIYEHGSSRVAQAYDFEEMLDWTPFYDKSLDRKMRMIVYAGEFDQRDGPLTQIEWMRDLIMLDKSGGNFYTQSRKIYYIKDSQGKDQVGGYYRYDPVAEFTFLTIPKAGHFVPAT